jgi:pyruvate/2-oxoglutarate dehydrogenase complex dihydrolipoamide acyltransferase (E2) component
MAETTAAAAATTTAEVRVTAVEEVEDRIVAEVEPPTSRRLAFFSFFFKYIYPSMRLKELRWFFL